MSYSKLDFSTMTNTEVALFIKTLMNEKGLTQKKAAQEIGYSESFVTQHLRLLELPSIFDGIVDSIPDYSAVYRLSKVYERRPQMIENWLKDHPNPTSRQIRNLLREADQKTRGTITIQNIARFPYNILIKYRNSEGILLLDSEPSPGNVWVKLVNSGKRREVPASAVRLEKLDRKLNV